MGMGHGRFEESLVVSTSLDELFVQLSEVICGVLDYTGGFSNAFGSCLSFGSIC
jgi:hypothetical protein